VVSALTYDMLYEILSDDWFHCGCKALVVMVNSGEYQHSLRFKYSHCRGLLKFEYRVSSLKSRVSSLKSRVSSLKSRVSSLKNRVSSLKSRVSSLKTRVSSLKSRVSRLKNRVSSSSLSFAIFVPGYQLCSNVPWSYHDTDKYSRFVFFPR
jgi:predicted nuclease with TOPRIM domain